MWISAFPLSSLGPGTARVVRHGRDAIAVWRTASGQVHAVDNRCPHEGYPLVQGVLKGCTLTCAWHNFKFDLATGACTMGDEPVRTWPVRVVEGQVEVDVAPRPAPLPALWESLAAGVRERKHGQMARDVVRLLDAGVDPVAIAGFGAVHDALHAEYGPSHALPVARDILEFLPAYPGLDAALPLVEALDVTAEACLRRPPRARGQPRPGDVRALVESEDAAGAEGAVRALLAAGARRDTLEPLLATVCTDHFLDFGHALIYQSKVFDLLDRIGWEHADAMLGAHVYGITNGTREDTLPAWAGFRKRYASIDLDALDRRARSGTIGALAELDPAEAFAAVAESDAPLPAILDALTIAAAERVLRFDVAIDTRAGVQDDWLDVTHRLTFVEAVRRVVTRWDDPYRWRLVLFAAHFVATARPYDGERPDPALPGPPGVLRREMEALALGDHAVRGIVVAHLVKMVVAAFAEWDASGSPLPVAATWRLLHSPVAERRVGRRVAEAIRLVQDGKPPVRLVD